MKLFIVFMTVLVSTSCVVTEYQWPGPLVIPSDGTKAIESGSIRVQLPDNFTSVSRHVKVREGVEVTLDCSPMIKTIEDHPLARLPSPVTWSVKYYNSYSKTFGYQKIENDSYSFVISGDKNSQLKIKEVSFSTPAKFSVTENSSYVCEVCYDEFDPFTGTTLRTLCHNSTSRVQAIGNSTKKGIWRTGAWSECTQECGGGRRQRSVTCVDSKTNEELSSSKCNAFKPSENEPCNLQDCCFDVISLCSTVKSLCSYNKIKYMCCKTCSA